MPQPLDSALLEVDAVLQCAGSVRADVSPNGGGVHPHKEHYVDISGEIEGFEALARWMKERDARALCCYLAGGFECSAIRLFDRVCSGKTSERNSS